MAERFAIDGANVLLCDVHEDKPRKVAKALPSERFLALRCDLTDFSAAVAMRAVRRVLSACVGCAFGTP